MKNLKNIEASIANTFARIELINSHVLTFHVMPVAETDMRCSIIGLREYKSGQGAIFVRQPDSWLVRFRRGISLPPTLPPGITPGAVDEFGLLCSLEVETQLALYRIVQQLDGTLGEQHDLSKQLLVPTVDSSDLCLHFLWFDPNERLCLPSEFGVGDRLNTHALARLEVSALKKLGRARGSARDIEECDILAGQVGWNHGRDYDGDLGTANIIPSLLQSLEAEHRLLQERLDDMTLEDEGRVKVAQELEWTLTKLVHFRCRSRSEDQLEPLRAKIAFLRLELIQLYNSRRLVLLRQNTESWDRKVELALITRRMARLMTRVNPRGPQMYKTLSDEADECKKALPGVFQEKLEAALAGDFILPHPYAYGSGNPFDFGHFDPPSGG